MRTYTLQAEQRIARPLGEIFPFFAEPRNLERLTPPWLRFEILTPGRLEMRAGLLIDYRIRLHGLPLRWQSEITVWDPPRRFIDEQRRGPYRLWIHEHTFEESQGVTTVRDCVNYAVFGGAMIRRLFVAPDLERIFSFRREALQQLFGS